LKKLLAILAAGACAAAYSSTWHEAWHGSGDAGDLTGTAHVTQGLSALTQIFGNCGQTDCDVYKIKVSDFNTFGATTVGGASTDTMLWLFDSTGKGVVCNDDSDSTLQSRLTNALVTANGDYYLAISRYARRPVGAGGAIWTTYGTGGAQMAPNGPGALDALSGWETTPVGGGDYTITCTGTSPSVNGADETPPPPPSPPANSWVEESTLYTNDVHGDAGELVGTSQMTVGNGALNTIFGRINTAGDVDMFRIKMKAPANFAASTVNAGTAIDTQIWLFDASGMGIVMNDDEVGGTTLQSRLSNAFTSSLTVNGIYYLAVSAYDRDAYDASANQLWLDTVGNSFRVEHAPDDLGAGNPLDNWAGTASGTGAYQIDLTNCSYAQSSVITVLPSSFTVAPGSVVSGGLTEAQLSDDQYLEVRPGVVFSTALDPCAVAFTGTAPGNSPSLLQAVVEARSSANFIRMNIQAWDYTLGTPAYVTVGAAVSPLPFGASSDVVATRTLNAAQNIGPGNEMKLRLSFRATAAVFAYPWKPRIDECSWRYTN
jgi:hypothetical protein